MATSKKDKAPKEPVKPKETTAEESKGKRFQKSIDQLYGLEETDDEEDDDA